MERPQTLQMRPQELAIRGGKLVMLGLSVGIGADADHADVSEVHPLDLDLPVPATGAIETAEVSTIYVAGTNTSIKTGDVVLLVGKERAMRRSRRFPKSCGRWRRRTR